MRDFDKQMEMVLYHSDEGDVSVDAYIMNDSLWITQKAMAELFGVDKSGISRHLKKIFESDELDEKVVVAKIATTSPHGAIPGKTQDKESMFYNLDAIISVGYRVNSKKATQFRIWATKVLKEYIPRLIAYQLKYEALVKGKAVK
ncbi:MAG: virulence RhuM family protein [Lachnospiraceae bacterium]|nr:virulence RhuM family protein [Lachnospiraceae bacterium]MBQ9610944.1 virulence RhuM family protein [Lachnospiraceae bacterium]